MPTRLCFVDLLQISTSVQNLTITVCVTESAKTYLEISRANARKERKATPGYEMDAYRSLITPNQVCVCVYIY